ncbi:class I SAM-dependent methyltransferase [Chitinimonas sp.]|uniref:class I SAM-dependent methyltransferase n=1 Tax=Chitinimonas sp. TaxID=1934313 RepID=UPI002F954AAD
MTQPAARSTKTRDEIALAYKSEPWWYDVRGFFILTFAYNTTLPAQLRLFGRNFGADHLEIAIGSGTFLAIVLRWRKWKGLPKVRITGVDYAESMLAGAMRRYEGDPDMQLELADAAALPFEDNSFDTANIANAVHCFPDVDGAMRETLRVLRPGGCMVANVILYPEGIQPFKWIAEKINAWGIRKGILYTPYYRDDMRRRLLAAGFEIGFEERAGNCYNVRAYKPKAAATAG